MPTQATFKHAALALAISMAIGVAPDARAQSITTTGDVIPAGIIGPGSTDLGAATNLFVGSTGTGTMTVIDGATFGARAFFIGEGASADGMLTVSGANSLATASTGIGIGRNGIGVLNIVSGATVSALGASNFSTIVGEFAGSNGTVNVDGGTLKVDRADGAPFLNVGRRASGVLNVTNGGRVTVGTASSGIGLDNGAGLTIGSANFTSGAVTNAQGAVLVSGANSILEVLGQNASLNVGRMGSATTGMLTVENGGVVNAGDFLGVGRGREVSGVTEPGFGATGTVIVDGVGSTINIAGVRTCCTDSGNGASGNIGRNDGTGTLTIRNGGLVKLDARGATADSGGLSVGRDALSTGTVNIESGGRLELLSDSKSDGFGMTVGRLGHGTLNVTGGGQLVISNSGAAGGVLNFGGTGTTAGSGFSGLISGVGTAVTLTGIDMSMRVGRSAGSSGTVTINGGAVVDPGNRLSVGYGSGSSGTLNVAGVGTMINLKGLAGDEFGAGISVGRGGNGIANITDGAVLNVDGQNNIQRATQNVGGSGTFQGGTGILNVTGASTRYTVVNAPSASLVIGRDDTGTTPSTGTMTISDGAQVSFPSSGTGAVGYSPGSTGTLNVIGAGSRLDMGAFLGVGRTYNDDPGGAGFLNVSDEGVVKAASIHVGAGGTVSGNGSLEGTVTNDGTITPGTSPGTLSIIGDLLLTDDSVLIFEVAGKAAGQFDVIAVSGQIRLDGTLRLVSSGAYTPSIGDTLDILTFASQTGSFDTVVFDGFGGSATLATSLASGAFQVVAVPEPHEWVMLLAGLIAIGVTSRGRSQRVKPIYA